MWKLCFDQSYFWLVETIIGIKRKQFSKKELIFASGHRFSGQWQPFFFLRFSETPASVFPSSGKKFFKEILIFGQWKRNLELIMVSTSRKKFVNKRILFPIDRNCFRQKEILIPPARMKDSLKRYVSTTPRSCFHRQKYLKKKT